MKRAISLILSLLTVTLFLHFSAMPALADGSKHSVGDVIEFGTYPQSDVTASLGSVLNSRGGIWQSYGYYSGTGDWYDGQMTASSYMRYKDVTYNGNKYRGVVFDSYRPSCTGSTSVRTNQNYNGYYTGTTYWFKYEPIKWRILDPSTCLVMCNSAIDSQPYNNYILYNGTDGPWGDFSQTYYANNYAKSSIREWLNNDFYNTAFSDEQKSNIKTTTLNNDCLGTLNGYEGYEEYDAPSTSDKIFLLYTSDVLNSDYGFIASDEPVYDTARMLKGSDYAKCQGLYVNTDSGSEYDGNTIWWTRTPTSEISSQAYVVDECCIFEQHNFYSEIVEQTFIGVVPAMCLKTIESHTHSFSSGWLSDKNSHWKACECGEKSSIAKHTFDKGTVTKAATEDKTGIKTYKCKICGYIKTEVIPKTDSGTKPVTDIPEANIIKGNAANNKKTYDYKTTVTFTANVPEGGSVQWFVDGKPAGNAKTLTVKDKTNSYIVKAVVADKNGNQTMDEENVTIKNGFIDIIIWFFKHLFNPGAYDIKQ